MSTLNKTLVSLAIVFAVSGNSYAAADAAAKNTVRADFKNKVLLVPCVEVTDSPFDGFYNVVMEISGAGTGVDWKVVQANKSAEDECDSAPSSSSTDELLTSMGMPPLADLLKDDSKEDDSVPSSDTSAIKDAITTTITDNMTNVPKQ